MIYTANVHEHRISICWKVQKLHKSNRVHKSETELRLSFFSMLSLSSPNGLFYLNNGLNFYGLYILFLRETFLPLYSFLKIIFI